MRTIGSGLNLQIVVDKRSQKKVGEGVATGVQSTSSERGGAVRFAGCASASEVVAEGKRTLVIEIRQVVIRRSVPSKPILRLCRPITAFKLSLIWYVFVVACRTKVPELPTLKNVPVKPGPPV